MEYSEQLLKDDWKLKRQEIIERDKLTCQHCKNENYLSDSFQKSININLEFLQQRTTYPIWTDNDQIIYTRRFDYQPTLANNENPFIKLYLQKYSTEKFEDDILDILEKLKLKTSYKLENDKNIIYAIQNTVNNQWIYIRDLHVHHKYYQEGRLAWEYPSNAYITLCWSCHETIHENEIIDVYDINGVKIGEKELCNRCGGAGYFPQYSHVQGGRCFVCDGKRFNPLSHH